MPKQQRIYVFKKVHNFVDFIVSLEAWMRIELMVMVLQTTALPLGYQAINAIITKLTQKEKDIVNYQYPFSEDKNMLINQLW